MSQARNRSPPGRAVDGAAGNTITVHNAVAVSATVGLFGREGETITRWSTTSSSRVR